MKKFYDIINEIYSTVPEPNIPKLTTPSTNIGKRNANDQSKIAGKYFKGNDNVTRSMVSDRDRKANTVKGQVKKKMDDNVTGRHLTMSRHRFDKILNDSGGRTLNLDDGEEKIINSKDNTLRVKLLDDGRVMIRKSKD